MGEEMKRVVRGSEFTIQCRRSDGALFLRLCRTWLSGPRGVAGGHRAGLLLLWSGAPVCFRV
jgi:hypothetical protein